MRAETQTTSNDHLVVIDNVRKSFGSNVVLDEVSLDIDKGEAIVVAGPSGSGKSTMLRCINGLETVDSGDIRFEGRSIPNAGKGIYQLRADIGMVFQSFNLVDRLTVMENVQCGRLGYLPLWRAAFRRYPRADIRRAFELMERVGIAHYANKRADELSGGERQRVGVVRALMQEPQILLADEPTASLDPKTSEQIMELLRSLSSELSLPVLINIHNVAEAKAYTDRIVGMRYGRIIFDGLPAQLDEAAMDEIYAGIPAEERGAPDRAPDRAARRA